MPSIDSTRSYSAPRPPQYIEVQTRRMTMTSPVTHPSVSGKTLPFSEALQNALKDLPSFQTLYEKVEGWLKQPVRQTGHELWSGIKSAFVGAPESVAGQASVMPGGHTFTVLEGEVTHKIAEAGKKDILSEWERISKLPKLRQNLLAIVETVCLYAKAACKRLGILLMHRI